MPNLFGKVCVSDLHEFPVYIKDVCLQRAMAMSMLKYEGIGAISLT